MAVFSLRTDWHPLILTANVREFRRELTRRLYGLAAISVPIREN